MSKSLRSGGVVTPRTVLAAAFVVALVGTVTALALDRSPLPLAVFAWVTGTALLVSVVASRRRDDGDEPRDDGRGGLGAPVLRPVRVGEPTRGEVRQALLEEARRRRRGI